MRNSIDKAGQQLELDVMSQMVEESDATGQAPQVDRDCGRRVGQGWWGLKALCGRQTDALR